MRPSKNRPAPLSDAVFRAKLEARQPPIGDGRPAVSQEMPVHNTFIQFGSPEGLDELDGKAQMSTAPAWIGPSLQSMIQATMSSSTQATTPEEPKIPPPAAPVVVGGNDEAAAGDLPSMGSAKHHEGLCKRCCFYPKGRCQNGYDCEFCHFEHEKRKRKKKKKGNKNKGDAEDDSGSDESDEEGEENEQQAAKPPKPAKPARQQAAPTPAPLQASPLNSAGHAALMTPSTASSMAPGWQDSAFAAFPGSSAPAAPLGAGSYEAIFEAAIWGAPPGQPQRGGPPMMAPPAMPPAMSQMPDETNYTGWLDSQQVQAQGSYADPYYGCYGQAVGQVVQPSSIPPGMSGMDGYGGMHPQLSPGMYQRPGAEPRLSTYSPFAPQGAAARGPAAGVPAAPPPAPQGSGWPGYAPAMPQAPPAAPQSSSFFSAAGRPAPR